MSSTVPDLSTLGHMKARPTVYNGVKMRSRLEAGFAAWLDSEGHGWDYEPHAMATPEHGQWLPDFVIHKVLDEWHAVIREVYVEVKPAIWWDDPDDDHIVKNIRRWQSIVKANDPSALFLLATAPDSTNPDGKAMFCGRGPTSFIDIFDWHRVGGAPFLRVSLPVAPTPWHFEWWKA